MVKRAVAILAGVVAGLLLWTFVEWLRSPAEADDVISVDTCVHDKYVDCVSQQTPAPVVRPCKEWLQGSDVAALSRCLHEARRAEDGSQFDAAKRAAAIATST